MGVHHVGDTLGVLALVNFTRLVESTLLPAKAPTNVVVFHGTSSGKLERYMSEGIKVPRGDVESYLRKAAMEILASTGEGVSKLSTRAENVLRDYIDKTRGVSFGPGERGEKDKVIYAAVDWSEADDYANSFCMTGSEVYHQAWKIAHLTLEDEFGHYSVADIPKRFQGGEGVVLALDIPAGMTNLGPSSRLAEAYEEFVRLVSEGVIDPNLYTFLKWAVTDCLVFSDFHSGLGEVFIHGDVPPSALTVVRDPREAWDVVKERMGC